MFLYWFARTRAERPWWHKYDVIGNQRCWSGANSDEWCVCLLPMWPALSCPEGDLSTLLFLFFLFFTSPYRKSSIFFCHAVQSITRLSQQHRYTNRLQYDTLCKSCLFPLWDATCERLRGLHVYSPLLRCTSPIELHAKFSAQIYETAKKKKTIVYKWRWRASIILVDPVLFSGHVAPGIFQKAQQEPFWGEIHIKGPISWQFLDLYFHPRPLWSRFAEFIIQKKLH